MGGSTVSDHEKRAARWHAARAKERGEAPPRKSKRIAAALTKTHPLRYIFDWYLELRSAQGGGGMGVNPLSNTEILSYRTLYEIPMDVFDLDTLRRIDWVWLQYRRERDEADKPKGR